MHRSTHLSMLATALLWTALPGFALDLQHGVVDPDVCGHRAAVDIDLDGRADLVVVRAELGPNWIIGYTYPTFDRRILVETGAYPDFQLYRSDDVAVGDMDNDGDVDIIGRLGQNDDGDGIVAWWENPGGAGEWQRHDIGHTNYAKDITVADFDLDGSLGVAVRENERTHVFARRGAAWERVMQTEHPSHEGMSEGDLDGDGDVDLVLNGFWLRNPHPRPLTDLWERHDIHHRWFTQTGNGWQDNNSNVAVADVDGDGRLDVLLSQSELPGFPLAWYGATDPMGVWSEHIIEPAFDYCQTLQAGDIDGDGNTDILAAVFPRYEGPHPIVVYLGDGTGRAFERTVIANTGMYHGVLADLGSDGALDILGTRNWDSPPIEVWENLGRHTLALGRWTYIEVDNARPKWGDWDEPTWAKYFGLGFGDVTGDGLPDIVSGRTVYVNPGGDLSQPWVKEDLGANCDAALIVDVDGRGTLDIIASAGSRVLWFSREALGYKAHVLDPRFDAPDHGNPQGYALAQIIPGGPPEALLNAGALVCYAVPGDPTTVWSKLVICAISNGEGIGVGDLDGDGDVDAAVAHEPPDWTPGQPSEVKWCENPGDGSGGWPEHTVGRIDGPYADRIGVADLNADGRSDIIVTEEAQLETPEWKTYWFEAPTDPVHGHWERRTMAVQHTINSLDVADMDRDGDIDVVLGEHRGLRRVTVLVNDGVGGFAPVLVDEGKESHLGARVCDLDLDGDLDIVSIAWDEHAFMHLWRNDALSAAARAPASPTPGASPPEPVALQDAEEARATLVLHWPLDGDALDVSGHGLHGNAIGVAYEPGPVGECVRLGGGLHVAIPSDALAVQFPSGTLPAESFSIGGWVKLARLGQRHPIVGKQGNEQRGFMLMVEEDDRLTLELFRDQQTKSSPQAPTPLESRRWYHVVATCRFLGGGRSHVVLYTDGVRVAEGAQAVGPAAQNTTPFTAGLYRWTEGYTVSCDGWIDDVRVYTGVLSDDEVWEWFAQGTP